ncbi:hypothetical protein cypCar_00030853 [Cyprinus carpio]|nr:hypothetical protein cypCar_00030853 [Cyprinus carpio]
MPPSPLDDRIVVALPRPIRPQELRLRLDTSYLEATVGTVVQSTVISSTTVVKIQATKLTYMPSSSGSTRSLTCGCSSASCCTVTTYEKDGQVSASSPNLNSGVGYGVPTVGHSEAYSAPSLTSSLTRGGMRVIHPNELAKKLTHCPLGHPVGPVPVIIDCRPFMEFNKSHIRGAVHINCSDKISRRRLQQGKITVLDLISCRQSKDSFKGIFSKELVVYDESTVDPGRLTPSQPLQVVLESLWREGKDPIVLKEEAHQAGRGLLIHCQAGVSRSATIVIAYLMKHTWMTMTDAYKFVKSRRPIISPNLNFMGQLLEFEEDLNNGITPRILTPKLTGLETVV